MEAKNPSWFNEMTHKEDPYNFDRIKPIPKIPPKLKINRWDTNICLIGFEKMVDLYGQRIIDTQNPFSQHVKSLISSDDTPSEHLKDLLNHESVTNVRRYNALISGESNLPWVKKTNSNTLYKLDSVCDMHHIKFKRLIQSVKKRGIVYDRGWPDKGLVTGYIVTYGDDFRFIVTRGIHRVHVYYHLGYSSIYVERKEVINGSLNNGNATDRDTLKYLFNI